MSRDVSGEGEKKRKAGGDTGWGRSGWVAGLQEKNPFQNGRRFLCSSHATKLTDEEFHPWSEGLSGCGRGVQKWKRGSRGRAGRERGERDGLSGAKAFPCFQDPRSQHRQPPPPSPSVRPFHPLSSSSQASEDSILPQVIPAIWMMGRSVFWFSNFLSIGSTA